MSSVELLKSHNCNPLASLAVGRLPLMSRSEVSIGLGKHDDLGDRRGGWREAGQGSGLPGPWLSWSQPGHHGYLQRVQDNGSEHWAALSIIPLPSRAQPCARHCPDAL